MTENIIPFGLALNTLASARSANEKAKAVVQYYGCFTLLLTQLNVPHEAAKKVCITVLLELAKGQGIMDEVMKGFDEVHAYLASDDFRNAGSCCLKR